ncbi:hypothetical protein M8J77_019368 [Diaphorina citri]|nr:hypothetical protein M8J77_019368 [Diaphorina citri]
MWVSSDIWCSGIWKCDKPNVKRYDKNNGIYKKKNKSAKNYDRWGDMRVENPKDETRAEADNRNGLMKCDMENDERTENLRMKKLEVMIHHGEMC